MLWCAVYRCIYTIGGVPVRAVLASTGGKAFLHEVFLQTSAGLFMCKRMVQVKQHFFCVGTWLQWSSCCCCFQWSQKLSMNPSGLEARHWEDKAWINFSADRAISDDNRAFNSPCLCRPLVLQISVVNKDGY